MMIAGHADNGIKCLRSCRNALVIRGDHHFAGAALDAPFVDVLQHRLAVNIEQSLTGQTGRRIASGNNYDESGHAASCPVRRRDSICSISGAASTGSILRFTGTYQSLSVTLRPSLTASFSVMNTSKSSPNSKSLR